jgi:hypothetical protein
MVDRLARAGLVCTPDPDDLRRVLPTVTSTAAQMIGKIDPDTARQLQAVLSSMSSAAQRVLTEVLKDTARRLAPNQAPASQPLDVDHPIGRPAQIRYRWILAESAARA